MKCLADRHYHQLGGRLQPILDTIRRLFEMGFWLEIVTLVIPGFNDSDDELTRLAEFLASVSADIPWHVTAFHKDYKMTDPERSEEHTSELQSRLHLVCRLLLEKKKNKQTHSSINTNTKCSDH